jgi:hypothetical protein
MKTGMHASRGEFARRLVLSGTILLLGLLFTSGAFADFTSTGSAGPEPILTGQVHVVLAPPTGDHGSLIVGPITDMAEGDTMARIVELTNDTSDGATGTTGLAAVNGLVLKSAVSGPNAGSDIVTDARRGLHVTVRYCRNTPVESGRSTGPWTYTCAVGFVTVLNNIPLANLDTAARNITASAPLEGASRYYVVQVTLPAIYPDSYTYKAGVCSTGGVAGSTEQLQNCSLSITYTFTATQRVGSAQ